MDKYPKRLIEVDLPIKRISAHARREKSIRHGHISTLHIWWARRPLAACRAVICASLWPDPADELCPAEFRKTARELMTKWAKDHLKLMGEESSRRFIAISKDDSKLDDNVELRKALLDFIADFANWDNSAVPEFLKTSRTLTQAAHEALGGEPGSRPLVVDPFAGGGAIPLEALRVGADAFASDLNPVAVLLNKVVLEYIPKYGQRLADEVRKWGQWIKEHAEKELAIFYPKDPDESTPISYIWARTILSEAPGQGDVPVEVPLISSMWLANKKNRKYALKWVRDKNEQVKTEIVEVAYADGVIRKVCRPILEIFEPKNNSEVETGTVVRGSATCPVSGFTTHVNRIRAQLKARTGGTDDARLICVVTTHLGTNGRFYRLSRHTDLQAVQAVTEELRRRIRNHTGELSIVPTESNNKYKMFNNSTPIYGMESWGALFTKRQALTLTTFVNLVNKVGKKLEGKLDDDLLLAVITCLAIAVNRIADRNSSLCRWINQNENVGYTFGRQALPMLWDFVESPPMAFGGGWNGIIQASVKTIELQDIHNIIGTTTCASATKHPLPDDSAQCFITDPPYYYSVQYAGLSDFFYVWLKRSIGEKYPELFSGSLTPKDEEIVVSSPTQARAPNGKNNLFFEKQMCLALSEGRRVCRPDGIGVFVFAHLQTVAWESFLQSLIDAGWIITATWPIDTERPGRIIAMRQSVLGSSIHLVCRPRENPDGSLSTDDIGDWRDVLSELPKRIHNWMPCLAEEGVVGADAIFACLGPALEIYSRYSSVEKASGEKVELKEYLEQVWAAVSREALKMIFEGADASGFGEDSRLTAMWLWTLRASAKNGDKDDDAGEAKSIVGYDLEYDAARKIAQGLGAHLENLGHLVKIKGNTATLLSAGARTRYLFGKDAGEAPKDKKGKKSKQLTFDFEGELKQMQEESGDLAGDLSGRAGSTVLDKLHQSMILFGAGRGEALKRFLVEDGVGLNPLYWRLAQALSALYPSGTDEKRWVDGVLARKKGLGF